MFPSLDASVVDALPFEVFLTYFYRIKDYDDGTTTMDMFYNFAGLSILAGITDYIGWNASRIWAEFPLARDFDDHFSQENQDNFGINWAQNVTHEMFWAVPKSSFNFYPPRLHFLFSDSLCRRSRSCDHSCRDEKFFF